MMKLYRDYYKSSISMASDRTLVDALITCIAKEGINYVIETGTYLGLGSTRTLVDAFQQTKRPAEFVTFEANYASWKQARNNLAPYTFVRPLWGKSVTEKEAVAFIESDPLLLDHRVYPGIWIDDIDNPREFYINEVRGNLETNSSYLGELKKAFLKIFYYSGDDLLKKYLLKFLSIKPLIVLDSAGGIGFLEFSIVREIMGKHPYVVLLDDIHHLKHFRSIQAIRNDKTFSILAIDESDGWVLAKSGSRP